MKRLSSLILLIATLTACVNSPTSATPTPKIETATPTPTFIITETAEPTSTVTPDPLADAPKGYTNFDKNMGAWTRIDADSGKTIFWDAEREEEVSVLFENDLWDQRPDLEGRLPDTLRLKVFISTKFTNWNTLSISHEENKNPFGVSDWTVIFQNFLWDIMIRREMIKNKVDFDNDTYYGEGYTRNYNTIEGLQTITLKHGNVITVHIVDGFEELKADKENNNFYEVVSGKTIDAPSMIYMIHLTSDVNGNTYVEIAPNNSDVATWSERRIMEMFLVGFGNALANPDDPIVIKAAGFSSDLVNNHDAYPYFIFSWQK